MFQVNKDRWGREDLERWMDEIASYGSLQNVEGKRVALCLTEPVELIRYIYFLKARDSSVLVLNGQMPFEMARDYAQEADCVALIYGGEKGVYPLLSAAVSGEDPGLCQYSSGTTGKPKLIKRSWEQVEEEIRNYNLALNSTEQPIILVPLSHSFGLIAGFMSALERGVEPIIVNDKNPKFYSHIVDLYPNSITYGVSFLFHIVLSLSKPSFRFHRVLSAGSALPETLFERLKNQTTEIIQQYGTTELGCITLAKNIEQSTDVGKALAHLQVELNQDPQHVNEVIVYRGQDKFYTKDYGSFSADGSLHILGRMDDMINVAGQKVVPYEVESVISRLEGVREVVVYKKKHPVWGEAVKALVVSEKDLSREQVLDWCKQRLAPYQVPIEVQFTMEIPKNSMGKISRKMLQELGDDH